MSCTSFPLCGQTSLKTLSWTLLVRGLSSLYINAANRSNWKANNHMNQTPNIYFLHYANPPLIYPILVLFITHFTLTSLCLCCKCKAIRTIPSALRLRHLRASRRLINNEPRLLPFNQLSCAKLWGQFPFRKTRCPIFPMRHSPLLLLPRPSMLSLRFPQIGR